MRLVTQQTASRASAKHLGSSDRTRSAIRLAEAAIARTGPTHRLYARRLHCPCANPLTFRHHKSHRNVPRLNLKAIRCHEALRYALQNHIAAHSRFRINKRIPTPLHQAPQSYKIFLCSQSVGRYLNEEFLRTSQPLNLPRFGPESRTVRVSVLEPSTLRLNIADGPCLRSEPSTITLHIADGSILQDRTFHVNASYHGWLTIQTRTLHAKGRYRGRFHSPGPNLPR